MATATLISPSSAYQPYHNHPSYSSGYHALPPSSQTSNIHGMVSPQNPVGPRMRPTFLTGNPCHLSKKSSKARRDQASTTNLRLQRAHLPQHFLRPSLPRRRAALLAMRPPTQIHLQERSILPPASPRSEAMSAYSDPARHSVSGRPPPPPPPSAYPTQHPSPPRIGSTEMEPRHQEPSNGYPSHASSHQGGLYPQTGRLPPGQLPLSGYDISPRQEGHALPSPYEAHRQPVYDDAEYPRPHEYRSTLDRAFEHWSYSEALTDVSPRNFWRTPPAIADSLCDRYAEAHGLSSASRKHTRLPLGSNKDCIRFHRGFQWRLR